LPPTTLRAGNTSSASASPVADAYLAWSLPLLKYGGVDVADWPPLVSYLDRIRQRPQVKAAIETEQEIRKTLTV